MIKPKLAVDIDETVVYLLRHFLEYYNALHGTGFAEKDFHTYRWWEVLGIKKGYAYAVAEGYIRDKIRRYEPEVPFSWLQYRQLQLFPENFSEELQRGSWELEQRSEAARREERAEQGYGLLHDIGYGIEFVEGAEQGLELLYRFYDIWGITDRSDLFDEDTFEISSAIWVEEGEDGSYFPDIPLPEEAQGGALILPHEKIIYTETEGMTKAQICKARDIGIIIDDNADVAIDCAEQDIISVVLAKPWNKNMPEHPRIIRVADWQGVVNALVRGRHELPYPEYGECI